MSIEYYEIVEKLSFLEIEIEDHKKNCEFLKNRINEYINVNNEQAEAYTVMLNENKKELFILTKKLEKIELKFNKFSKI